ncbi:MAG: hypothetical protein LAQ30_07270 [Acidobacteriia bacterium]|nr:hypothetical protein [Terriglobia bacterium]
MIQNVVLPRRKRLTFWTLGAVVALAASALALEGSIRLEARALGNRAAVRFGGDRITGLTRLVNCDGCDLHERDMAVWALGELRDRRALPVLDAHFTGATCDHNRYLCQYELRKAIMKIEGTWGLFGSKPAQRQR